MISSLGRHSISSRRPRLPRLRAGLFLKQRVNAMPTRVPEKIDALDRMIWSKETWISDHGEKRPAHEVEIQRANLEILEDIRSDYQKSLDRAKADEQTGEAA